MITKNKEALLLKSTILMYKYINDTDDTKKSMVFNKDTSNYWNVKVIDNEYYNLIEETEDDFIEFAKKIGKNNERNGMTFYGDKIGIMTGISK